MFIMNEVKHMLVTAVLFFLTGYYIFGECEGSKVMSLSFSYIVLLVAFIISGIATKLSAPSNLLFVMYFKA